MHMIHGPGQVSVDFCRASGIDSLQIQMMLSWTWPIPTYVVTTNYRWYIPNAYVLRSGVVK